MSRDYHTGVEIWWVLCLNCDNCSRISPSGFLSLLCLILVSWRYCKISVHVALPAIPGNFGFNMEQRGILSPATISSRVFSFAWASPTPLKNFWYSLLGHYRWQTDWGLAICICGCTFFRLLDRRASQIFTGRVRTCGLSKAYSFLSSIYQDLKQGSRWLKFILL